MTNSQRLAAIRRYLDRWLVEHHGEKNCSLQEAVLIRDGYYAGRQFRFGGYQAVWFIEEDELKIRDAEGNMLACVNVKAVEAEKLSLLPGPLADEPTATIPLSRASIGLPTGESDAADTSRTIRRAA